MPYRFLQKPQKCLSAKLSCQWNDISLMQVVIYWELERPCGSIAFWYRDISHVYELAIYWLPCHASCISQHFNHHNDDCNIIRFLLWCVSDFVIHFLWVNLRSYFSAELRRVGGNSSLLLTMGMHLSLPLCSHFSVLHRCEWCFLWMSQLMKEPSCVINIFTGLRIVCVFNYQQRAHLLFLWHVPAKWKFIPLTLCISAHQLCRLHKLHIYAFW